MNCKHGKALRALLASLALLFGGCSQEKVPDGRILFKNDTLDKSYNKVYISGGGVSRTLGPQEYVILPRGTTRFSVSRQYKDHTRSYSVECPPLKGSGIRIKMIDIHVNRIAGGCTTVRASKS
ncbi:MAG: hypothetical protein J5J00_07605 [Deltaproteobacteria bacterium]|nr:hypothetical protein [Deltaproteobacteria bacterium]